MAAALVGCAQVARSSTPTARRCRIAHQRRGELRAGSLRHQRQLLRPAKSAHSSSPWSAAAAHSSSQSPTAFLACRHAPPSVCTAVTSRRCAVALHNALGHAAPSIFARRRRRRGAQSDQESTPPTRRCACGSSASRRRSCASSAPSASAAANNNAQPYSSSASPRRPGHQPAAVSPASCFIRNRYVRHRLGDSYYGHCAIMSASLHGAHQQTVPERRWRCPLSAYFDQT